MSGLDHVGRATVQPLLIYSRPMGAPPRPNSVPAQAEYFEDWQDGDGLKFPRKIRRAMAGTTSEEWTVTKVKVNPTIDPKKFAVEG